MQTKINNTGFIFLCIFYSLKYRYHVLMYSTVQHLIKSDILLFTANEIRLEGS